MRKLGFWQRGDLHQVEAINEAAEELDHLQSNTGRLQQQVVGLQTTVRRQQAEIDRLKSALQAVCDLLVDLDLIEEEALGYRIDAALAEPVEPVPVSPFDRVPGASARTTAFCSRCHRVVPAAQITFTDGGPMCDPCIGAAERGG